MNCTTISTNTFVVVTYHLNRFACRKSFTNSTLTRSQRKFTLAGKLVTKMTAN